MHPTKEITTKVKFVVEFISKRGNKYLESYDSITEAIAFAESSKNDDTYKSIEIYMIEEKNILTIK